MMTNRYIPEGGAAPLKTEHTNPEHDPVALGREAWDRRKNDAKGSWGDWKAIGKALTTGREEAIKKAGTNTGKKYAKAYSDWLQLHGFDDLDKSDRAKLLNIMDDIDHVERWRATLTETKRRQLNSPSAVWRGYENKGRPRRALSAHQHSGSVTRAGGTACLDTDPADDLAEVIAAVERAGQYAEQLGKRQHGVTAALVTKVEATAGSWRRAHERLRQLMIRPVPSSNGDSRAEPTNLTARPKSYH